MKFCSVIFSRAFKLILAQYFLIIFLVTALIMDSRFTSIQLTVCLWCNYILHHLVYNKKERRSSTTERSSSIWVNLFSITEFKLSCYEWFHKILLKKQKENVFSCLRARPLVRVEHPIFLFSFLLLLFLTSCWNWINGIYKLNENQTF